MTSQTTDESGQNEQVSLAELMDRAQREGFETSFEVRGEALHGGRPGTSYVVGDVKLVRTQSTDMGTDPGDDATIYLIETKDGEKGFLLLPYGTEADMEKAAFVDALLKQ